MHIEFDANAITLRKLLNFNIQDLHILNSLTEVLNLRSL
jgi:hypothetical protein